MPKNFLADVPLTDLGKSQAETAREIVNNLKIKPNAIVHSHLSRARDTASIINQNIELPMHETPLLGEQHYGDWQGQPHALIRPKINNNDAPPNGETIKEFTERTKKGLNYALKLGEPVLIVCHGGIFRALHKLYGLPDIAPIQNCKLYKFEPIAEQNDFPWKMTLVE